MHRPCKPSCSTFRGLDALAYPDIAKPLPKVGEVVIRVKGFGIHHAEMHMRRGEQAEAAEVSGIECIGIVDACPGGNSRSVLTSSPRGPPDC